MTKVPSLEIFSHVEEVSPEECDQLLAWSEKALPLCLSYPGSGSRDLPELGGVEISIVSDGVIAEVHGQFLDDPTPTDVITFQHGELLVSHDTAKSVVQGHQHSALEELFLYIVHGLLHLNGHLDHEADLMTAMHEIQDRIWGEVLQGN